jgi:hypothetical protein
MQPDIESVKNFYGSFQAYAKVLVSLIPRHLRFMHVEAFSQLTLRHALRYPH